MLFHDLSYVLKHNQDIFLFFLAYKTLKAIATLFFSNFFESLFSDVKFLPSSQLYLFIKGLIFVIFSGFFLFFHDLTRLLQHTGSIYYLFLVRINCCFFVFNPINRIYVWSTTIQIYFMTFIIQWKNIIKDKLTTFHWFFQLIFIFFWSDSKNCSITLLFKIQHDFYVVTFRMYITFFIIVIFRRNKINFYF